MVTHILFVNWVVAEETVASKRILESGTDKLYDCPFAEKLIEVPVRLIVMGSEPAGKAAGLKELLNQMYRPAAIAVELKLETMAVLLILHSTPGGTGLMVITTFCVLLQPFAFNVYT